MNNFRKKAFVRARVDGVERALDEGIILEKIKTSHRYRSRPSRCKEGCESRLQTLWRPHPKWAEGIVVIQEVDGP